MSILGRLSAAASNLNERAWGAAIRLVPVRSSQYSGRIADPDRAMVEVRGIVSRQHTMSDIEGARRGTQMQGATQMSARTTRAFIKRSVYAALNYQLRQKDVVELMDEDDARYEVVRVEETDTGDTVVELSPIDADPEP